MCVSLIVLLDQLLYRHDGKGEGARGEDDALSLLVLKWHDARVNKLCVCFSYCPSRSIAVS